MLSTSSRHSSYSVEIWKENSRCSGKVVNQNFIQFIRKETCFSTTQNLYVPNILTKYIIVSIKIIVHKNNL